MSIRLEMIQVARVGPSLLGDATGLVQSFLQQCQNEDGGFRDRQGASDLYYTVFGMDALHSLAVGQTHPNYHAFIQSHGCGEGLDFVHLCCLIRCLVSIKGHGLDRGQLIDRLMGFRTPDGGFHPEPNAPSGTAYGAFLAVGALQDLGGDLEVLREGVVASFEGLKTGDGGWGNDRQQRVGATNATAAVMTTLRQWDIAPGHGACEWLLQQCHPMGGFLANPMAPIPDLLSTATALHALAGVQHVLSDGVSERCLDYLDSLWTNAGSFHGHWHEDELDTEYTFYGLLALGHLSG
jgi:prenyltransferase beta subunit